MRIYCLIFSTQGDEKIATTRIIAMHQNKGKTLAQCLHDRTDYAKNPAKTEGGELISAFGCDPKTVDAEFLLAKSRYQTLTGRKQSSDVIAYQVRQSFRPGEVTPEEANRIGYEFAERFLKGKHAFIVATHTDKAHIHNHIIWNSTTLDFKHKFRDFKRSAFAVQRLSDMVCAEHGLSVIKEPKGKGKSYNKWLGQQPKLSHREQICMAVDEALAKKPKNFDELLQLLMEAGCEIKTRKNPSIRIGSSHRFARFDTLGPGYSVEELRAIIAGSRQHKPRRRAAVKNEKSLNLLIDIQAKMQQGKGVGYERWAKSFNLKQMAQTLIFLQEHGLTDYDVLAKKASGASAQFNELSEQIKAAEKRMAEISVLRTHIINYAKTREIYAAYRKAGYSKKFLQEHESDILLHKAAKTYFDGLGIQKLPSVKNLNAEYASLLTEKKKLFADYRKAREEMKELLLVKSNVDQILGIDSKVEHENEKNTQQRS